MAHPPLSIRQLHTSLGAEVIGADLSKPLPSEAVAFIRDAWFRHLVLVFRQQAITDAEQVAFSRNFGELEVFPLGATRSDRLPEIFRIANTDEDGNMLPADAESV